MSIFQMLFIAAIILITVFINRSSRLIFSRVFFLAVTAAGFLLLIFPESASRIANSVGIGRGADLIFYMFILFAWSWFAAISSRLRKSDRKITTLVRSFAIAHPLKSLDLQAASRRRNEPTEQDPLKPTPPAQEK